MYQTFIEVHKNKYKKMVTNKDLDQKLQELNSLEVGVFEIETGFGGYQLKQILSSLEGFKSESISQGYCPRKQLLELLMIFIQGIKTVQIFLAKA